jgi:alkane 1-monooxygenase
MKDLKYLIAYIGPISAWLGLYLGGWYSFGITYIAFGIIPLLELITPIYIGNHPAEVEEARSHNRFFDFILYLHVPFLYATLAYGFYLVKTDNLSNLETIGLIFNLGIMVGAFGINVGHELGHRDTRFEQFLSKALLLPALYQHFYIEHNRGHHKNVATDADPASARLGENLYAFWLRSVVFSYRNAWVLEKERLERLKIPTLSWQNEMLRFQVFQAVYLLVIGFVFGNPTPQGVLWTVFLAMAIAITGFLLLETVNYIEHYGLRRRKLPNGRYEPVQPHHSWNSDHAIGRIFLYELTRHSDHHYRASRKYQILRHFTESPQLPFGYPLSMVLSLVPPLWFSVMNRRVPPLSGT